jgi:hypothetical protein
MLSKLKNIAKTSAWLTVGVTAIAVESAIKASKHIHNEVKSGMPQELVNYHVNNIKAGFKSNPVITRVTNPDATSKEAIDRLNKIKEEMHNIVDKQDHVQTAS